MKKALMHLCLITMPPTFRLVPYFLNIKFNNFHGELCADNARLTTPAFAKATADKAGYWVIQW